MALQFRDSDNVTKTVATIDVVNNITYPVNSYYVQYPDASSNTDSTEFPVAQHPATLFGGTWAEQWSTEAIFFRTRGVNSDIGRVDGKQTDQLQGHDHKLYHYRGAGDSNARELGADRAIAGGPTSGLNYNNTTLDGTRLMSGYAADVALNGTPRIGTETRVTNRRIKVWKRTA
ncbi:MAG: hypothetical protein AB7V16_11815 [Vulcanibacillus sp.]